MTSCPSRPPAGARRARAPSLLVLACAALVLLGSAAGAARAQADDEERAVRYRVDIDAPRALAKVLESALDLVRWQSYENMTAPVLERLIAEGVDQAKEAAAAQGYFSAKVDIAVEQPAAPDGRYTLRIKVDPGAPARIATVNIAVDGPALADAQFGRPAVAQLEREWMLPPGAPFTQESWDAAKARAVGTLAASPYAAASIAHSEARVDPVSDTVAVDVAIASGPAFRFGDLVVEGLAKYDASVVRNFRTVEVGQPYTKEALDEFTRRLLASRYFASVQSQIVADPALAAAAPVRVAVIEAPRKRIEGGLSYATDSGPHADARYTDVNIDGHALQLELDGRVDQKIQNLGFEFRRPPTASGYIDSLHGSAERTDISSLVTRTAVIGVRRQTVEERRRTGYGAAFYLDEQSPAGAPAQRSHALLLEIDKSWRNVDSLVLPTRGWVLHAEAGVAPPGVSSRLFGRVIAQFGAWKPLTQHDELYTRAEGGVVLAPTRDGIPSALLFRTGGDTTVRGYAFQTLGVQEGDATVGGRYYYAASTEAAHYFNDTLGAAVFVDAGNAGDVLSDLRPAWGYGIGLRVKSPVGRFRADIAYGQETGSVRLHMSVGVAF